MGCLWRYPDLSTVRISRQPCSRKRPIPNFSAQKRPRDVLNAEIHEAIAPFRQPVCGLERYSAVSEKVDEMWLFFLSEMSARPDFEGRMHICGGIKGD